MPAAGHGERGRAVEDRRAGQHRHRLALGVVVVPLELVFGGLRAVADEAVFGMQHHAGVGGDVVGHFGRDAHAEIDVLARLEQLRRAQRHLILIQPQHFGGRDLTALATLAFFGVRLLVAALVVEHDAIDVDARAR